MIKWWKRSLAIFSVWCAVPFAIFAQQKNQYIVYLKDGSQLTGEILEYQQGIKVSLQLNEGQIIEIPDATIDHIGQQAVAKAPKQPEAAAPKPADKEKRPLPTRTDKGFYNVTSLHFGMAGSNNNGFAISAGISSLLGYRWSALAGFGVGGGMDNYSRKGETLYPVFAEWRLLFPARKNNSGNYYLSLAGGYGFAFKRESLSIIAAKGGYLAFPSIGYRAVTSDAVDINFDLGVRFQKAFFARQLFNQDIIESRLVYRRLVVRVGISLSR